MLASRGLDERVPVARIGDVAGDGGGPGEPRGGGLERPRLAGVDHEPPAALGEGRESASPRPREAPVTMAVGMPGS